MTLAEKIMSLYPAITMDDICAIGGYIQLQNDADGRGDYISEWNHPDFPKPSDQQLAALEAK